MSHLKTQFADSVTSDFEDKTWTFEMNDSDFVVTAGNFAIIPRDKYDRILKAFSQIKHWDDDLENEFGDPGVLATEILNLIV